MKKTFQIFMPLFICFRSMLLAQNYFPLDSGYLNCVQVISSTHCHGGHFSTSDIYYNGGVIKDTIIEDKKFFQYRYGDEVKLLYYNYEEQILYIRSVDYGRDTILKAFNFNLDVGEKDTFWFNNSLNGGWSVFHLITKSIVNVNGLNKFYLEYSDYAERKVKFIEDLGLIEDNYWRYNGLCEYDVKETLISAINDSMVYNRIYLWIDSTNLMKDKPINLFPYHLKVNFSSWSQPIQLDTFQVEVNLIRNDSVILSSIFEIQKDSFSVLIPLDSSILKFNDTIAYRVYVTDTSIFHNRTYFPHEGFKKIKILNPVTYIIEPPHKLNGFFISQNYPNPFNPNTKIEYSVQEPSKVTIKVFDLLGREIATLVDEEKSAGNYKVEFNGVGLPSGIYFYRMET
ncbi:MAG: T9SS type A sorting domain-containing protein, partial [Ignavibacteria bacterium]